MKIFTIFRKALTTSVKDIVSLLVICCLLFGSLTIGAGTLSLILSSCSPKNNLINRDGLKPDGTAAHMEKKKVEKNKDDEKNKPKINGRSPLVTPKGSAWWNSNYAIGIGFVVTTVFSVGSYFLGYKYVYGDILPTLAVGAASALVGGFSNQYMCGNYSFSSFWSGAWRGATGSAVGIAINSTIVVRKLTVANARLNDEIKDKQDKLDGIEKAVAIIEREKTAAIIEIENEKDMTDAVDKLEVNVNKLHNILKGDEGDLSEEMSVTISSVMPSKEEEEVKKKGVLAEKVDRLCNVLANDVNKVGQEQVNLWRREEGK